MKTLTIILWAILSILFFMLGLISIMFDATAGAALFGVGLALSVYNLVMRIEEDG
jgi:hypothetical protein